jgi:tuftelin-interacting protein 11
VESQESKVKRLREVMVVVGRVKEKERDAVGLLGAAGGEQLGPKVLLEPFVDEFDELLGQYPTEYEEMGLDEVVVGAIAPIVSSPLSLASVE